MRRAPNSRLVVWWQAFMAQRALYSARCQHDYAHGRLKEAYAELDAAIELARGMSEKLVHARQHATHCDMLVVRQRQRTAIGLR